MVRTPAAKAGGTGFDSRWLPWVFLFQLAYYNVNGMRDLLSIVHLGCYQHRYKWKDLWCSSSYSSAAISIDINEGSVVL